VKTGRALEWLLLVMLLGCAALVVGMVVLLALGA
jgi:hypothetical protein